MIVHVNSFDEEKKIVSVTFRKDNFEYTRDVNAVVDENGVYDEEAMKTRINEVALGVISKVSTGVIRTDVALHIDDEIEVNASVPVPIEPQNTDPVPLSEDVPVSENTTSDISTDTISSTDTVVENSVEVVSEETQSEDSQTSTEDLSNEASDTTVENSEITEDTSTETTNETEVTTSSQKKRRR